MLFQPSHFAVSDRRLALELIAQHPLATLVSRGIDEPDISHVPLVAEELGETLVLHGHLARANPHWQRWQPGSRVVAIFHGPQAYISPFAYSVIEAVPTWNYAVVHTAGTIETSDDPQVKEAVLKRLIDTHDVPYRQRWDELSIDYRERMKRAIVAFAITVDRIDAKFKLSQNRSAEDRAGVSAQLRAGGEQGAAMVEWMRRLDR